MNDEPQTPPGRPDQPQPLPGTSSTSSQPVPAGHRPIPGRPPMTSSTSSPHIHMREEGRGSKVDSTTRHLANWLNDLKARQLTIRIDDGKPIIDGPLNRTRPDDRRTAARHQHALAIAANGTHPDWWRHTAGLTDTPPHRDDIPTVADPDSGDWTAHACACCGQPATIIDQQLLPWCPPHTPHELR